MTISLPRWKIDELRKTPEDWPGERNKATVREVLVLARKLHHVAYVIRPEEGVRAAASAAEQATSYWARESGGGGGAWGKGRRKAEAKKAEAKKAEAGRYWS